MSKYNELIELIRKGDIVLFIGSGFSFKAGAPSGSDLCDVIYNALPTHIQEERSLKTEYTLQKLSDTYETHYGRDALMSLLRKAFDFEKKDTSDQRQLTSIPQFKHIITTNYDSLLEEAYSDDCNLVITNSDLSKIDPRKTTIYKIHGDFSHPENIVITKRDYHRLYTQQQENLIWDSIRVEFSRHNVLFIGYSISDQNIQILIEQVKKQMKDAVRRLFVLTPKVEETALLQFKELGAEYIEGKAEDLFNELIPDLKNHIVEDYRQRATSAEDCDRFLRGYDLRAKLELGGLHEHNKLLGISSVSGKNVNHKISITFKGNGCENPLNQIKPYFDSRFGNLPVRKITKFDKFEYRANDILIHRGDNISAIYLLPCPQNGEICISIPQKKFLHKTPCRYYNNGSDQLQIDANIDTGILQITISISHNISFGFNLKHNDKYTNNTSAIAWARVFYAIFSGYEFSFTISSKVGEYRLLTHSFKKDDVKREKKDFKRILQYYNYIQEIELLMGKCFDVYHNFSNENFEAAQMIYHYLKKEPLIVRHNSKGFEYNITSPDIDIKPNNCVQHLILETFENIVQKINGVVFTIPYMQIIFKESILKSKRRDKNGNIILSYVDKAKEHTVQLTDNPIQINLDKGNDDG